MNKLLVITFVLGIVFVLVFAVGFNLDFNKEHKIIYKPYNGEVTKVPVDIEGLGEGHAIVPNTLIKEGEVINSNYIPSSK